MPLMSGFVGGTVLARAPSVAHELTINMFPARVPSPDGKGPLVLYGAPGSTIDTDLGTRQPVRAAFSQDGRAGFVSGDGLFEYFGPGSVIRRGSVALDTMPATICSNGLAANQWFVVSGGRGYIFNLSTNAFAVIADADFPANAVMGGYMDGYFFVLVADGRFFISALNNGTSWAAADVARRSQGSDTWRAMVIDPPTIWLLGSYTTEPWYDNGAAAFPFTAIPNAFIDVGVAAPFSAAMVGGQLCWLGQNREGIRAVYATPPQQFSAMPISDAIAPALADYTRVDDAIGWGEAWDGHLFYVLTFPTQNVTWVFDLSGERVQVHQRGYWRNGEWEAWRGRSHCVVNGRHLVGSRLTGIVYEQSLNTYDDAGDDLRWLRQPPRVWLANQRLFQDHLELHQEPGVGGMGPGDPRVDLEWSNDGGHTWSNVHQASLGRQGTYLTRVHWRQLGAARDRVYRFSGTAPTRRAFVGADLAVIAGTA